MDTRDLRPNSDKYKAQQKETKEINSVVSGKVAVRKKSAAKKLADIFIAEDIKDVKEYVIYDILVPGFKEGFVDIVTNAIEMIFLGRRRSQKRGSGTRVSYSSYYEKDKPQDRYDRRPQLLDPEDIIFDTREDAERVRDAMTELIDVYGKVSIGEFYDLAGYTSPNNQYTDRDYGWVDVHSIYIQRVREGYLINLPRAIDIR